MQANTALVGGHVLQDNFDGCGGCPVTQTTLVIGISSRYPLRAMCSLSTFTNRPYKIVQELGHNREGGRISYLAKHTETYRKVVIKQFRFAQSDTNWNGFKAYQREIAVLQQLDHPRIPRYLDSFETDDGFCMVQEYQDSPSLASQNHYSPQEIQAIAISVLEILVDLQRHQPPIIHRDIKPENILVDECLRAYLIDFGLARIQTGDVALSSIAAGTPGFMPPEELFGRSLTPAADLYSLGATLIGLLTQTRSTEIGQLLDEDYRFDLQSITPQLNPQFLNWLHKMVEPHVKKRFITAAEALENLKPIDITDITIKPYSVSPQRIVLWVLGGIAVITGCLVWKAVSDSARQQQVSQPQINQFTHAPEQHWFKTIKPYCNALEATTTIRNQPHPNTTLGVGYAAACYALAGKIPQADRLIQQLPPAEQQEAARIVFEIGHPVADAGDDESAGPMMELVLHYWPQNYMARYHAGMSAFVLRQYPQAEQHLKQFLEDYSNEDRWRRNAQEVLSQVPRSR